MTQVIEITITPVGETKLETKGFSGPSCRDASKFIEEALGAVNAEQLTGEFHEVTQLSNATRQQT